MFPHNGLMTAESKRHRNEAINIDVDYWMRYSIGISKKRMSLGLRVGAVLVSQNNKLLCSAYSGEEEYNSWCSVLMDKLHIINVNSIHGLFLTINTYSSGYFDLLRLYDYIGYDITTYVGLPDPALSQLYDNDPVIVYETIQRFPDNLQKEILETNSVFYSNSGQNLKDCHFYFDNRIGSLIVNNLKRRGYNVPLEFLNANRQRKKIARWLCRGYGIDYSKAMRVVNNAISDSFNQKYSAYNNVLDIRSIYPNWMDPFWELIGRLNVSNSSSARVINVGVGSGDEAVSLFKDFENITFVDVATDGLAKLRKLFPFSQTMVCNADDLCEIADNRYDLYVSLRTYNSSFFNIKDAVVESFRVLKKGGSVIISIANGFLNQESHKVLPGLIIPATDFIDIYRGYEKAREIKEDLMSVGFVDIGIHIGDSEIFISGRKTNKNE